MRYSATYEYSHSRAARTRTVERHLQRRVDRSLGASPDFGKLLFEITDGRRTMAASYMALAPPRGVERGRPRSAVH